MTLPHQRPSLTSVIGLLAACMVLTGPFLGLAGCSDDSDANSASQGDGSASGASDKDASAGDSGAEIESDADASNPDAANAQVGDAAGPLVIVTERESTDGVSLHYLHVVSEWPESGELDYSRAVELGKPGVAHVDDAAIYFYHAEDGEIEKLAVDDDLHVTRGKRLSFVAYGISGFDPEPIWASHELAFMLDERTAQIARFNPSSMQIDGVDAVNPDVLERDGLKVQFQLGIAAGSRIFTAVNWRSWDTNKVYTATVLGAFDQDDTKGGPTLIEDTRCAASVAIGPFAEDGYVYAIGDGVHGFDLIANPNMSDKPQCVVRMPVDGDAFEEDFFIDLQEVTGSPAIYMVYPMGQHKLLVSMWSPEVPLDTVKDPDKPGWFWELPPYYEYAIIDMDDKSVKPIPDLPRAAMHSPKVLIADGKNYVQLFREDRGSSLHRVDPDGTVTHVLDNPSSTNVQFIGRL